MIDQALSISNPGTRAAPPTLPGCVSHSLGAPKWRIRMKRLLVSYLIPSALLADWVKTDPERRKAAEEI
jgi:hypothetical protein